MYVDTSSSLSTLLDFPQAQACVRDEPALIGPPLDFFSSLRGIAASDIPVGDKLGAALDLAGYDARAAWRSEQTQGGLQVLGGMGALTTAAAIGSTGPWGTAVAVPLGLYGADQAATGIERMRSDEPQSSMTYEAVNALTGSSTTATLTELGLGLAAMAPVAPLRALLVGSQLGAGELFANAYKAERGLRAPLAMGKGTEIEVYLAPRRLPADRSGFAAQARALEQSLDSQGVGAPDTIGLLIGSDPGAWPVVRQLSTQYDTPAVMMLDRSGDRGMFNRFQSLVSELHGSLKGTNPAAYGQPNLILQTLGGHLTPLPFGNAMQLPSGVDRGTATIDAVSTLLDHTTRIGRGLNLHNQVQDGLVSLGQYDAMFRYGPTLPDVSGGSPFTTTKLARDNGLPLDFGQLTAFGDQGVLSFGRDGSVAVPMRSASGQLSGRYTYTPWGHATWSGQGVAELPGSGPTLYVEPDLRKALNIQRETGAPVLLDQRRSPQWLDSPLVKQASTVSVPRGVPWRHWEDHPLATSLNVRNDLRMVVQVGTAKLTHRPDH